MDVAFVYILQAYLGDGAVGNMVSNMLDLCSAFIYGTEEIEEHRKKET